MSNNYYYKSLHQYAEKLSKSQQRNTIPLFGEGHPLAPSMAGGVCAEMAVIWLKEQLNPPLWGTQFPRLAHKAVANSKRAKALTANAAILRQAAKSDDHYSYKTQLSILLREANIQTKNIFLPSGSATFDNLHTVISQFPELGNRRCGALIGFGVGSSFHCVSVFVDTSKKISFYDGNAGSYLLKGEVGSNDVIRFFKDYTNICLAKKWPSMSIGNRLNLAYVYS